MSILSIHPTLRTFFLFSHSTNIFGRGYRIHSKFQRPNRYIIEYMHPMNIILCLVNNNNKLATIQMMYRPNPLLRRGFTRSSSPSWLHSSILPLFCGYYCLAGFNGHFLKFQPSKIATKDRERDYAIQTHSIFNRINRGVVNNPKLQFFFLF